MTNHYSVHCTAGKNVTFWYQLHMYRVGHAIRILRYRVGHTIGIILLHMSTLIVSLISYVCNTYNTLSIVNSVKMH